MPHSVLETLSQPNWKNAMEEEMNDFKNNHLRGNGSTKGKKLVECKWVFTMKHKSNDSLERYKARIVAKRYTQTYGMEYRICWQCCVPVHICTHKDSDARAHYVKTKKLDDHR